MPRPNSYQFKCWYYLYLLFVFLVDSPTIHGQPREINFTHYGVADGFDSKEAMSVAQTKDGLLWISSTDGLIRFDSKRFKYFRHNSKDSLSLAHNYCKAIQVDKQGRIWVAANDDLDIFDPATETFQHIKHHNTTEGAAPVRPKAFYYDQQNAVMWVATANGLFFSRGSGGKLESVAKISKDTSLLKANLFTITAATEGWLWITTANQIIKLHTRSGKTENYEVPQIVGGLENKGDVLIISSYFDKQSTLWLGTVSLGLFSFNSITKTFQQYTYRNVKQEDNTIFSITQTALPGQEDVLFFGATGLGFGAFNTSTKKFTSYNSGTYNTSLGIKGNAYGLRCFDNKLWIGSSTGLHCYDYSLQLFEKKDLSSIANGVTLLPTELMAAERNSRGKDERLWLFVPYKDAYIYDLTKDKVLPVPAAIQKYTATDAGIFCMHIDQKNILWLGTNAYGLVGYDIQNKKLLREKQDFYKSREWVRSFFEDSRGNLWLCTYNGLFYMDSARKNVSPAAAVNALIKSKDLAPAIAGITEDEYGKIWISTDFSSKKNAAILTLDVSKNKAAVIYNERKQSGNHNYAVDLRGICSNRKGKIFVIFRGEHIAWLNSNATGEMNFKELGREQGLSSAAIDELLSDASGNMWCNNSFGISQYKVNQNSFSNYILADYEMNTTNNPSVYISPNDGSFYIGQANSFLVFNYNNNPNSIQTTNLLFNELKIYNTPYGKKIKDGDKLLLNYKEDMISVEFALLSYSNSPENRYSWKLEGLDKAWNTSRDNVATYNHLVPGTYTLLVKAANSNGDWKTVPIKLHITIRPPFYATWWFKVLVLLFIAGLIWFFIRRRIKRIKEKFELRNRIASDLHDEIGSTLTSINILSNVSRQAMEQQPTHAKELLQQISNQSKNIQQNMSDIVWSIRPDNEKIENLVVRIREYAAQTLEPLNIDTLIEADDELVERILPMQYRKDILLISKEAINNIARHSNANAAKVVFKLNKKNISLSITDNGRWKGNHSGTGSKTMKERAKGLGGQLTIDARDTGTTVAVLIPIP
ncbi:MAG: hypothetical protein EOO13_09400 [Chitinophagaceae bacterium]|nr:MAG: hypothetical protein EOO13_09400 [Chitinophagaceae bacterium]